ncbi:MAG TPA: hypothetical protein VL134_02685 [Leptolyngbya sp.]|jgi:hypothetical protein|nr:hypothetical protein [Leptolyngbya sp.]
MSSSVTSSLQEINDALLSHNPFAQPPFLNPQHVWGKAFPDVKSLNAHASDAIFQALDQIRQGQYSATSILVTAQDGTGKTHIISRIRHQLQAQGGALFVYTETFNDLNNIKNSFQQLLADSLDKIGSQEVTQWQELATEMANQALKVVNSDSKDFTPKELVNQFEKKGEEEDGEERVRKWIDQLSKAFRKARTVKDPDVVRAIFWTLCDDQAAYAFNWLGGKELAQYKANEMKLPVQRQSFDATLQILELISYYNELVICFDNLDLDDFSDAGYHRSQVVAGLVKELFENLHRGVILTVMMPGTWRERVKQLPGGIWTKVQTHCEPLALKSMDGNAIIELVLLYLDTFYASNHLVPPHSTYPFEETQLRELGRERLTIRRVLSWCREHCRPQNGVPPVDTPTPPNLVELAFVSELNVSIKNRMDDNYFLADALLFGFQAIVGQIVEGVRLKEVTTGVGRRGRKDPYLNFKVLCEEDGSSHSIGVAVLQYDGGGALGAGLRRLLDSNNSFAITRGCLIRSKNKLINAYFRKTYLDSLITAGGEFVELIEQQIQPLIAIRAVYQKRNSDYQLTEEDIFQFIKEDGERYWLGKHNPLLQEILSAPSYQLPDDIEDEPECLEADSTDDSDLSTTGELEELTHA